MERLIACLIFVVGISFGAGVYAQEVKIPDGDVGDKNATEKGAINKGVQTPLSHKAKLDRLMDQLKKEVDPAKARLIEKRIWAAWSQSGSASVDLLMQWSQEAMGDKRWGKALDLLDQVIVLAPQYSEGWNRRAIVHFMTKEYGQSLSDIEQVLRYEPRHFGALAGMAQILNQTKQQRKAQQIWLKVLEIYPAHRAAQKAYIDLEEKLSGRDS